LRTRVTVSESDIAVLYERVRVDVDELKAMGWTVERIIARLKQFALEVGFGPRRADDDRSSGTI
jgi:hypothetical protein